tara:strand:+ start:13173 stop:13499 length:327 start_codon:yes stop_codon:yes gene_type:complete
MINILFLFNLAFIFFVSFIYIDLVYKLYHYDSYIHFIMYFILGFLVQIGDGKAYLFKFLIVLGIPFITEYGQNFIEMRRADPIDMYYNYLGLLAGVTTVIIYRNVKKT